MHELPWWKVILMTLGILAVAAGIMFGGSIIGLDHLWVAFLALVVWTALGMKMEQAPGVFVGAAVGMLLALGVEALPDLYGDWAVVIPLVAIVLVISCHIKGVLPLIANVSTFLFLTLGTADIGLDQRLALEYFPNLAFGAVLFWIIPWSIMKLRSQGQELTNE